mgnify:FL=1
MTDDDRGVSRERQSRRPQRGGQAAPAHHPRGPTPLGLLGGLSLACALIGWQGALAQDGPPPPAAAGTLPAPALRGAQLPAASPGDRPLPINLPAALQLANVRAIDIALAGERVGMASAQLERARVLWLPTLYTGVDYLRHDGRIQSPEGDVVGASRGSVMLGAGPYAVFAIADAVFSPLAARQVVRARQAGVQAATNDTLLAVAVAYFDVQQARGELVGAEDARLRAEDLVRRTERLAEGLVLPVEVSRARTELARRRHAVRTARERWRTSSADLVRLLRLDPSVLVEPLEPPDLRVTLLPLDRPVDDLIPVALANRPELASHQALVQATVQRLRQERLRPLVPSVLLRGASTGVPGTLAGGAFGGGRNDSIGNFGARADFDVQVLWELQNLGFGNRARVRERRSEHRASLFELMGVQDRVAAEVDQTYEQARSAADRMGEAEAELREAHDSVEKNFEGLGQTRRAGNLLILLIRPQEAVASVQALAQAYNDYFDTAADYNRAQFRLYRALGHPAQAISSPGGPCAVPAATNPAPPLVRTEIRPREPRRLGGTTLGNKE